MAKRLGSIGKLKHPKGPRKTQKRLEAKKEMLAKKATSRKGGKKGSKKS